MFQLNKSSICWKYQLILQYKQLEMNLTLSELKGNLSSHLLLLTS